MARPLRIEYEGAFYHVTARGNDKKKIFLSLKDYDKFLSYLQKPVVSMVWSFMPMSSWEIITILL
jgi:hypothetical protein